MSEEATPVRSLNNAQLRRTGVTVGFIPFSYQLAARQAQSRKSLHNISQFFAAGISPTTIAP